MRFVIAQARRLIARDPRDVASFIFRRGPRIPRILFESTLGMVRRRERRLRPPRDSVSLEIDWTPLPMSDWAKERGRRWVEEGIVDLFNRDIETGWAPIDWNPPALGPWPSSSSSRIAYYGEEVPSDIKGIWELHRQLVLPAAAEVCKDGREDAVISEMLRYAETHPPHRTVAWMEGIEVAIRAISWIDSLSRLNPEFRRMRAGELHQALREMARFLETHLSRKWRLNNNHLLLELVGLVVLTCALPNLPKRQVRLARALKQLLQELDAQTIDGRNWEPTTAYHRFVTEALLIASHACSSTSAVIDEETSSRIEAHARSHVRTLGWLSDESMRMPLVGDDDAATILPRAAGWQATDCTEVFGFAHASGFESPREDGARMWPGVGMAAMRSAGWHLHVVAGAPQGLARQGSHRHLDMLSITLTMDGEEVIIDSGTGTYFGSRNWRDHFRSERSHSGIYSDSASWAEMSDLFEIPDPPLGLMRLDDEGSLVLSCDHRAGGSASRTIGLDSSGLRITDHLDIDSPVMSFVFPEAIKARLEEGSLVVRGNGWCLRSTPAPKSFDTICLDRSETLNIDKEVIEGSRSKGYGEIGPAWKIVMHHDRAVEVVTTLVGHQPN